MPSRDKFSDFEQSAFCFTVMKTAQKKTVQTVNGKSEKRFEARKGVQTHQRNGGPGYDTQLAVHVAGMIDMASRVVGLTPLEIIERTVNCIRVSDFQEGWEKRTITIELNPSDWRALEELAKTENPCDAIPNVSIPIMEAITSRFTAKELATMSTGGSIEGVWGIQRALELAHEYRVEREAKAKKGMADWKAAQ